MRLALNPDAAAILGVKIALGKIELSLADFAGGRVTREASALDTLALGRTGLAAVLIERIEGFLVRHRVERARLAEIVIACQGFVDTRAGSVVWSPAFAVRDLPVTGPLRLAFAVPCALSNDANMIAEALHGGDPERYSGTFAVIFIDYGVGMGLFVDNRLFTGETGAAAEFGHANHFPGGRLCRCGKRGCLEAYLGDYALISAAERLSEAHDPWTIEVGDGDIPALIARAQAGDAHARRVFEDAGRALGYGIARLIAILDPAHIALTGTGMRGFELMRAAMTRGLEDALVADLRRSVTIDPHPWDEDLIGAGIVAGALKRLDRDTFSRTGTRTGARAGVRAGPQTGTDPTAPPRETAGV